MIFTYIFNILICMCTPWIPSLLMCPKIAQAPAREHPMFGDIFPPYVRGHLWVHRHRITRVVCKKENDLVVSSFFLCSSIVWGRFTIWLDFFKGHNDRLELNMDEHFNLSNKQNGGYSGEPLARRLIHMKLLDRRSGMFGRKHRGDSWW